MKTTPGAGDRRDVLAQLLGLSDVDLVWVLGKVADGKPDLKIRYVDGSSSPRSQKLSNQERKGGYHLLQEADVESHGAFLHHAASVIDDTLTEATLTQFSASEFLCKQGDEAIELEVNRSGNKTMEISILYHTEDHSAIADTHYAAKNGVLVLPAGAGSGKIRIELKNTQRWQGLVEFRVSLDSESSNPQLQVARVKIISESTFPSNKHHKQLTGGSKENILEIDWMSLLFEYLSMNFSNPAIRSGTIRRCLADQLQNVTFMVHLFCQVYLLDHVVAFDKPLEPFWILKNRLSFLLAIACLDVLCVLVVHLTEYRKYAWPVGGPSRKALMQGIMSTFLNMDSVTSSKMSDQDQLTMGLTRDSVALVKHGYTHSMQLAHTLGECLMLMSWLVLYPILLGRPFRPLVLLPFIFFPLAQTVFIYCRAHQTTTCLRERQEAQDEIVTYGHEALVTRDLILDYHLRQKYVDDLEAYISRYNSANRNVNKVMLNNKQFMVWMTSLLLAAWTIYGGTLVIQQKMSVAIFVTTFKVFGKLGKAFARAYAVILNLQKVVPALVRICTILNSNTDLEIRQTNENRNRLETTRRRKELSEQHLHRALDHIPIVAEDIVFQYANGAEYIRFFGKIEIEQGSLVCFVGAETLGKSTLLKLLGGAINPNLIGGTIFIPAHLRVQHVLSDTLFFHGSLLYNLTIGTVHEGDSDIDRVRKIMGMLKFKREFDLESDEPSNWKKVLTMTERHKFNIARALITNTHMLCVHKPTLVYDEETSKLVVLLLRRYVQERGLCQDHIDFDWRRPRTCIFSSSKDLATKEADVIFRVDNNKIERTVSGSSVKDSSSHVL